MKLNWGWGIVLALAGFIGFIMFFFVKAQTIKQDDLVSEEYYDEGLQHDERVMWIENARSLSSELEIIKNEDGSVSVLLPNKLKAEALSGNISFKRMNNAKLDVSLDLDAQSFDDFAFGAEMFLQGNYRFKAKLEADGTTYYWDRTYVH